LPQQGATGTGKLDAEAVLNYVRNNSGQKGEVTAAEFGTDTATLRAIMKRQAATGAIGTEGLQLHDGPRSPQPSAALLRWLEDDAIGSPIRRP